MPVLQFNPEHRIRQGFKNFALNYYRIFFWHIFPNGRLFYCQRFTTVFRYRYRVLKMG
jgi:hypothetical protein